VLGFVVVLESGLDGTIFTLVVTTLSKRCYLFYAERIIVIDQA
jgi:hypothetical protein